MSIAIDFDQLGSALKALCRLNEFEKAAQPTADLLENSAGESISVMFRLAKYPPAWTAPKRLKLSHPLYDEKTEACLISRSPQKQWKQVIEDQKVQNIRKVIDLDKLRLKYREQKDRQELQKSFEVFFVDKHLLNCVPQFLGKDFRHFKKDPIALTVTEKHLSRNVSEALEGTYLMLRQGQLASVKIGRSSMPVDHLAENFQQ
eukprot:GHVN01089801.1.p2 GENE.GHVN01089801.1~~GHVN01089801.1.p2  ORF type:complete len:203 (+),score=33.23 GHVN01089801.1:1033-1641(+)